MFRSEIVNRCLMAPNTCMELMKLTLTHLECILDCRATQMLSYCSNVWHATALGLVVDFEATLSGTSPSQILSSIVQNYKVSILHILFPLLSFIAHCTHQHQVTRSIYHLPVSARYLASFPDTSTKHEVRLQTCYILFSPSYLLSFQ